MKKLVAIAVALSGCGSAANFNQIWGSDEESSDSLLMEARSAYDRAEYNRALELAKQALERSGDNESAAVLLGNTYLALAETDVMSLARSLAELSTPSTGAGLVASSTNDTNQVLSVLSKVINLSDTDIDNLGDPLENNSVFNAAAGTEIIVPRKVDDTLRASIPVLANLSDAVRVLCPYVSHSVSGVVQSAADTRHACSPTSRGRKSKAKAHFVWAMAHLVESVVYQTILFATQANLTSASSSQKSILQAGAESLSSTADLTKFAKAVKDIDTAISSIFQLDDEQSQIRVTIRNLEIVNAALKAANVPSDVTNGITKSLESVQNIAKTLEGKTGSSEATDAGVAQALQGQMTKAAADKVAAAIESRCKLENDNKACAAGSVAGLSAEDKAKIKESCAAYDELSSGIDPSKRTAVAACTAVN